MPRKWHFVFLEVKMLWHHVTQTVVLVFGGIGFFLIAWKKRIGWWLVLATEPFWLCSTWLLNQWGMFALTIVYTVSCLFAIDREYYDGLWVHRLRKIFRHFRRGDTWRCEACLHQMRENIEKCPKCGSEDLFPLRYFRCGDCTIEAEQQDFWPNWGVDDNPATEKAMGKGKCPDCGKYNIKRIA
jgi:hypothetical protein